MDSIREPVSIKTAERERIGAKEALQLVGEAALCALQFLLYIAEYAISSVYHFFASEKAAYLLASYKKVICGAAALISVFIAVGIIGGMEAGLISLAVGAPLFLILCGAFKLLSGE